MASTNVNNVTTSQILEHRTTRKCCGLVGCITGRPAPEMDFFGYRDVQIWFRDAAGHLNGDPGFNRRDPYCFCFDCRGAFDPQGALDAELVNEGHERACETYASLLQQVPVEVRAPPPTPLLQRTLTHYPGVLSCVREDKNRAAGGGGSSSAVSSPPPPPPRASPVFPPRIKIPVRADDGEVPFSLPAPRHRDIMNESRETRLKKDLFELLTNYRGEMITIMDSRRSACFYDDPAERDEFLKKVRKQEDELWDKIHAAELLIRSLDD